MALHSAYGLSIESNLAIPGLAPAAGNRSPDVRVWLGIAPPNDLEAERGIPRFQSPASQDGSAPTLMVWAGKEHFVFRYGDGTSFWLSRDGAQIWAQWQPSFTLEDVATYLVGPLLGFTLRVRGILCLHASAVVIEGKAVALMGLAGVGKSTTAAACSARGMPVLSDDIVAVTPAGAGLQAWPGYPRLNLWPDVAQPLFGSFPELPRITPNWDKLFLDLTDGARAFHPKPLPLGAVYCLQRTLEPGTAPRVEPLPGRVALMEVVANTFANYLLDSGMRAQEFAVAGRLVSSVPVRRLLFANDPAAISGLPGVILGDFENRQPPGGRRE